MSARLVAILGLIALLSTSACAASPSTTGGRAEQESASRPAAPAAAPAPAARQAPGGAAGAAANQAADQAQQNLPSLDRMIIRTVTMSIAVGNVQETYRQVEQIVAEKNGYLANTQIRQDGDRQVATVTLRVPADPATYQATLEQLRGLAERVVDEQAQAQDITEEYVDLESRLRNLRASEESLLALMSKATRVEDIINIQRELTNVRGQIEQIQGRKQALERRADMATITLTIREVGAFSRPGWSPGSTFEEAVRALGAALRGLVNVAIWLAVFSPIWGGLLLLGWLLVWLFVKLVKRMARSGPSGPPAARPTSPAAPATPAA
jgi:hypothetical protein